MQTSAASLDSMAAKIAEHCESLSYITTGIFVISLFLSILRPDPTLAVCLFGFYGVRDVIVAWAVWAAGEFSWVGCVVPVSMRA